VFDPTVSCTVNGSMRFNESNNSLVVCGAGQWREVAAFSRRDSYKRGLLLLRRHRG
jgi:hypothetical protein